MFSTDEPAANRKQAMGDVGITNGKEQLIGGMSMSDAFTASNILISHARFHTTQAPTALDKAASPIRSIVSSSGSRSVKSSGRSRPRKR